MMILGPWFLMCFISFTSVSGSDFSFNADQMYVCKLLNGYDFRDYKCQIFPLYFHSNADYVNISFINELHFNICVESSIKVILLDWKS